MLYSIDDKGFQFYIEVFECYIVSMMKVLSIDDEGFECYIVSMMRVLNGIIYVIVNKIATSYLV